VTDRNAQNAEKLVTAARVFAASSRDGFASQYPTLNQLSVEEWEGRLTVAGVGTALLLIPAAYSAAEQKELTAAVMTSLHGWDAATVVRIADFIKSVTGKATEPEQIPQLIGSWILEDLELDPSEASAADVLGLMLVKTFGSWWDQ
jgi:hypothetical protein